jgi:hypothetical protein
MIETFNNYELLRIIETRDLLTVTCAKLKSRLYTREIEEEKKIGRRVKGEGIERGIAHVRRISFISRGLSACYEPGGAYCFERVRVTVTCLLWHRDRAN